MRRLPARRSASQQATQWPGAFLLERRVGARGTAAVACAQRGAKMQPGMASLSDGTTPRISASRARARSSERRAEARHRAEQRLRVGMARLREQVLDGGLLDLAAGIHDDDALGHLGDDAEVVRDEDDGGAGLGLELAHEIEDLRLHGDVERGGRLVGDQQLGIAGERHGDHDALAHAAGQLVRILLEALRRARGCRPDAASRWRALRAASRSRPWCRVSVSVICRPMVSTGLSEVIGSWKIIEMSLPRIVAHLALGELQQVACPGSGSARDDAAGRRGDQAQDRQRRDALAAAGLADDGQRLAGRHAEGHAVDRAHDAVAA